MEKEELYAVIGGLVAIIGFIVNSGIKRYLKTINTRFAGIEHKQELADLKLDSCKERCNAHTSKFNQLLNETRVDMVRGKDAQS